MNIIDPEQESEYGAVDDNGAASDEEEDSGQIEMGVITCVTEAGTREVEEVHKDVKPASILSYRLKTPYLLTQGFKENKKAHDNISKHMCDFGSRGEWTIRRISVSHYLDVDTGRYQ